MGFAYPFSDEEFPKDATGDFKTAGEPKGMKDPFGDQNQETLDQGEATIAAACNFER